MIEQIGIDHNLLAKALELLSYNPEQPMIFSSGVFLLLFCCFITIYSLLQRRDTVRVLYVIAFSLYFYYKSSGLYLLLLLFSAVSDFIIGRAIDRSSDKRSRRRWLVALSVVINLGMLGYFKYTNFFIDIASGLFGEGFLDFQNIFLPVGISFFVFQSMSYTIDIYREKIKPLDRFEDYLFYLSFFPQLVAGPIVRAKDFLPQIRKPLHLTRQMLGMAVFLIVTGLFKKAIISDYISLNFVDRVFDQPMLYSGFESLVAIYGYALQIYCDFSGYSDMAIGLALMLGFTFPKNFDAPYKSATITEFWRRWHISLSSWLRDYLYISLGGNRKGKIRTYINLAITMILGGLWHGAAVRFVLWGALHGTALALHKMWMSLMPSSKSQGADMSLAGRLVGIIFTFHLVCFGWLLFRADSMETVSQMLYQITHNFNIGLLPQFIAGYPVIIAMLLLGYILHFLPSRLNGATAHLLTKGGFAVQVIVVVVMIWCVMQFKSSEIQPFIYFQF
ncbi:MAG: MBOAT family O-acyltransferase [Rikenellaceae bacterium]